MNRRKCPICSRGWRDHERDVVECEACLGTGYLGAEPVAPSENFGFRDVTVSLSGNELKPIVGISSSKESVLIYCDSPTRLKNSYFHISIAGQEFELVAGENETADQLSERIAETIAGSKECPVDKELLMSMFRVNEVE